MLKKIILVSLILVLLPVMANAGTIAIYVATAAVTGSISTGPVPPNAYLKSYTGYVTSAKTFTITANSGYTLAYIKNNTVNVPSNLISGTGPWTYTIPLSTSTQTVYVYFSAVQVTLPPVLVASAPANVNAVLNTPQSISGGTSTISNLQSDTKAKFKWTSSPAAVFNPISSSVTNPANIISSFTGSAVGTYNVTLTLTAPGATASSASVVVSVLSPGVYGSKIGRAHV